MKTMSAGSIRRAAGALLCVAVAACEQPPTPVAPADPVPAGPGIHPVLVVPVEAGDSATVELHLLRVGVPDAVASFQGELRYDATRLKLARAAFPSGVAGLWNEVEPGRVRIASAAPEGLGNGAVVTLRFARGGAVDATAFSVAVEEVVAQREFSNLTSRVVVREHPLFSTRALEDH
jgi:hypothetical protein